MSEAALVRATEAELKRRGCWYVNNHGSGAGRNGTPDFSVIHRGRGGVIETKSPRGRLTPLQEYELGRVRRAGGFAIVARDVDDVRNGLDEVGRR